MLKPRALGAGDRIALVAPSSPFDRRELERGAEELTALGFQPVVDPRVFEQQGYLAGDARMRAEVFLTAWRDPSVAGVIGIRGGFGSAHLLPFLDASELRRAPKVFVGYSDLTSLLAHLAFGCELVAFHGPMAAAGLAQGEGGYDRASFMRCLTRADPAGELTAAEVEALRPGEAAGPLFGGTLAQIVASLGTPYAFAPPDGFVLFLDEVGERPYRLDRMLTQLRFSGVLARARAIVFGELPQCDEPGGGLQARAVVADLLRDFPGPVLFGFPSGHTARAAVTLPLGVRARVVGAGRPRLVIEEAAVT